MTVAWKSFWATFPVTNHIGENGREADENLPATVLREELRRHQDSASAREGDLAANRVRISRRVFGFRLRLRPSLSRRERISDHDMFEISYFLLDNSNVVTLDLCYNDVTSRGLQTLVNVYLKRENNLRHLDLTGCSLGPEAVKYLYGAGDTNRLKTLRLTGNKLGSKVRKCSVSLKCGFVMLSVLIVQRSRLNSKGLSCRYMLLKPNFTRVRGIVMLRH